MKLKLITLSLLAASAACGYEITGPRRTDGTQKLAVAELKRHLALVADDVPYTFVFAKPDGLPDAGAFESRYLVRGGKVWFWGDDSSPNPKWTKRNGTLFAVELFAERELGLRFLWPGEDGTVTTKPKMKTLKLNDGAQGSYTSMLTKASLRNHLTDRTVPWNEIKDYIPRELYDDAPKPSTFEERDLWQKRNRLQNREYFSYGHAFTNWSKRFGKTHPECLNLHIDAKTGEKIRGWVGKSGEQHATKHCVSNEGVVDQIIADWCKGGTNRYLNVCENDFVFWCECENCRALDVVKEGEAPFKHMTDRYVNFWNRIARKARNIRPDVMLVTYAYSDYRLPPRREKVEFGENMLFGFVFGVSEDAVKLVGEWRAAGMRHFFFRPNHLCSWRTIHSGYERLFYRQFHDLLKEGMIGIDCGANPNRPMEALEYYVLARTFSDQTVSFERIVDDFCSGFGAAAGEVKAYYEAVRKTGEAKIECSRRGKVEEDEYDYGYRQELPRGQERWRNERELADKLSMVEAAVNRHEKAGDLSAVEMRRLKSLKLQAEHGLLTYRFLVGVSDGTVSQMKAAADALNAFRVAHRKELKDNYAAVYRIWWAEIRYWKIYRKRLSEKRQSESGGCASALTEQEQKIAAPADGWKPAARWRGFNLLGMFRCPTLGLKSDPRVDGHFVEWEFQALRDWGFNFARLPLDYRILIADDNWLGLDERKMKHLDDAIEWGRKHGIHVQIALHRIPGYCILDRTEPFPLGTSSVAQEAACRMWAAFARRWKGIPNENLSFNLLNEPTRHTAGENYLPLCLKLIKTIRDVDAERFIMVDGNACASIPVPELYGVPSVGQAFRGYTPHVISHYGSDFIKGIPKEPPTWPLAPGYGSGWVTESPEKTLEKYKRAIDAGELCMIGEFGCRPDTPHEVTLAWMEHCLKLWRAKNLGWALWNLRGTFGVLDSGRKDVTYEDFNGHKLDRKMLELLRRY